MRRQPLVRSVTFLGRAQASSTCTSCCRRTAAARVRRAGGLSFSFSLSLSPSLSLDSRPISHQNTRTHLPQKLLLTGHLDTFRTKDSDRQLIANNVHQLLAGWMKNLGGSSPRPQIKSAAMWFAPSVASSSSSWYVPHRDTHGASSKKTPYDADSFALLGLK